ncbi:3914_t:CDS:1, partial [Entrophospora sp. SA101]
TVLEVLIADHNLFPFDRTRRIALLKIPYREQDDNIFTSRLIKMLKILYYINRKLKRNIELINKIEDNTLNNISTFSNHELEIIKTHDSE